MICVTLREEDNFTKKSGLYQWDYGQKLMISGIPLLENVEVHFAHKNTEALIQIAQVTESGLLVDIPDVLLRSPYEIYVYIYIADPDEGKTIKSIILTVQQREKPVDYNVSDEKNLLRQLLEEVKGKADNLAYENGYLQLLSAGKKIGERIRLTAGSGKEVELRNNGEAIQWRYTDENEWKTLILLENLRGPAGEPPEFRIKSGHLFAIYKN